jgi:dihydroxyacetone kinase-like predicted kinase
MKDDKSVSISKRMEELEEKMNWFKGDEFTLDEAAERYAEVEKMAGEIEEIYPDIDVDFHCGGQPIYYYVLSVE